MELEKEWAPPFLAAYKMDGSRRFCSFLLKLFSLTLISVFVCWFSKSYYFLTTSSYYYGSKRNINKGIANIRSHKPHLEGGFTMKETQDSHHVKRSRKYLAPRV